MAGMTWRRRAAIAVAATAALFTLAACGGNETPTTAEPTSTNGGQLGGAPTTTPAVTDGANPTSSATQGGGGGGGSTPTYPSKAGDYAVAFMKAWSAKNYNRLDQLGLSPTVQQAKDSNNGNGAPNSTWTMYSCSSVQPDNTVGCTVRNAHGDDARVTMNSAQLGHPAAVTTILLERTTYPSAPGEYVGELLSAKGNDNKQRVARLSTSTMFSKLTCYIERTQTSNASMGSGYDKVTVDGLGADVGKKYEFKVLASPGGKANAVKELLSVSC